MSSSVSLSRVLLDARSILCERSLSREDILSILRSMETLVLEEIDPTRRRDAKSLLHTSARLSRDSFSEDDEQLVDVFFQCLSGTLSLPIRPNEREDLMQRWCVVGDEIVQFDSELSDFVRCRSVLPRVQDSLETLLSSDSEHARRFAISVLTRWNGPPSPDALEDWFLCGTIEKVFRGFVDETLSVHSVADSFLEKVFLLDMTYSLFSRTESLYVSMRNVFHSALDTSRGVATHALVLRVLDWGARILQSSSQGLHFVRDFGFFDSLRCGISSKDILFSVACLEVVDKVCVIRGIGCDPEVPDGFELLLSESLIDTLILPIVEGAHQIHVENFLDVELSLALPQFFSTLHNILVFSSTARFCISDTLKAQFEDILIGEEDGIPRIFASIFKLFESDSSTPEIRVGSMSCLIGFLYHADGRFLVSKYSFVKEAYAGVFSYLRPSKEDSFRIPLLHMLGHLFTQLAISRQPASSDHISMLYGCMMEEMPSNTSLPSVLTSTIELPFREARLAGYHLIFGFVHHLSVAEQFLTLPNFLINLLNRRSETDLDCLEQRFRILEVLRSLWPERISAICGQDLATKVEQYCERGAFWIDRSEMQIQMEGAQ